MFLKLQLTCKLKDEALFTVAYCELSNFCLISIFFFLIGKQKTIIKEKLERVQVVHDDEQLGKKNKKHNKRSNQETKLREDINSEKEEQ